MIELAEKRKARYQHYMYYYKHNRWPKRGIGTSITGKNIRTLPKAWKPAGGKLVLTLPKDAVLNPLRSQPISYLIIDEVDEYPIELCNCKQPKL